MAKIRKDPRSGAIIFHHSKRELDLIKKRRRFNKDMDDIHRLKKELEKELASLKSRK